MCGAGCVCSLRRYPRTVPTALGLLPFVVFRILRTMVSGAGATWHRCSTFDFFQWLLHHCAAVAAILARLLVTAEGRFARNGVLSSNTVGICGQTPLWPYGCDLDATSVEAGITRDRPTRPRTRTAEVAGFMYMQFVALGGNIAHATVTCFFIWRRVTFQSRCKGVVRVVAQDDGSAGVTWCICSCQWMTVRAFVVTRAASIYPARLAFRT